MSLSYLIEFSPKNDRFFWAFNYCYLIKLWSNFTEKWSFSECILELKFLKKWSFSLSFELLLFDQIFTKKKIIFRIQTILAQIFQKMIIFSKLWAYPIWSNFHEKMIIFSELWITTIWSNFTEKSSFSECILNSNFWKNDHFLNTSHTCSNVFKKCSFFFSFVLLLFDQIMIKFSQKNAHLPKIYLIKSNLKIFDPTAECEIFLFPSIWFH